MIKSNPALLEWFSSDLVYREAKGFREAFTPLLNAYYSPKAGFYHYLHMARSNFREYLKGDYVKTKKYFYVLRPVLCMRWIETNHSIPPLWFETLVEETVDDSELKDAIAGLLARKKAGFETDYDKPIKVISDFLEAELTRLGDSAGSVLGRRKTSEEAEKCFKDYLRVA